MYLKRIKELYNKKYSVISFYVVQTAIVTFILGLIVYYLAGKTSGVIAFLSALLQPLVLGLVITYLLSPVVAMFERKLFARSKRPRTRRIASVLLTFAIVITILLILLGLIVVTFTRSLSSFNLAEIKIYLMSLAGQFSRFWTTIERTLANFNINLGSIGDMLGGIFNGVREGASTLLFASIFAVYFLYDDSIGIYWTGVLDAFTNEHQREKLKAFAADADKIFSGYIRGQSLDALLVGTMVSILLLIAGIPYAAVIGILTGVGNLVPYVGPVVGFGSLIIISLAEHSIAKFLMGAGILAVVMFVDGNLINPKMLSSNVEVHPVLVIVALLAGGKIGGVVGMLVAVPVAALLKHVFEKEVLGWRHKKQEQAKHEEPGPEVETERSGDTQESKDDG